MDPATENYEAKIPGWSAFSARTKFAILAKRQRMAARKRRAYVPKAHAKLPEGYLPARAICESLGVCRATVARWTGTGKVREFREGRNVAYNLEDIKVVAEEASQVRRGNSWFNRGGRQ